MHQVCVISLKLQAPIGIVSTRIEAHVLSLFQLDINSEAWTRPKQGCVRVGHVPDTTTRVNEFDSSDTVKPCLRHGEIVSQTWHG